MIQVSFEEYGDHDSWEEVILLWEDVFAGPRYPINEILTWIATADGGRYHLRGFNSTEGFCFRFERPADAVHFKLKWL